MKRIAIVGGGIAGVTAAWQLARNGNVEATLFEASPRLGGIVETVRRDGFIIECGPDGWVTEKPWARQLAEELGLGEELIASNDATRKTWVVSDGNLVAMPDGMRMMVPSSLDSLESSSLFSEEAKRAYANELVRAEELRAQAPQHDESVAAFVLRHFGPEVLAKIGAPLLNGVFGGDVAKLSVRAVMPAFVAMEREHGSLIAAIQTKDAAKTSIFTSLRSGTATLIDRMVSEIPPSWVNLSSPAAAVVPDGGGWMVEDSSSSRYRSFDSVILATPAHITRELLGLPSWIADFLPTESSSAVTAALAFNERFDLPQGFGFLVPSGQGSDLLAGTFVDQKFPDRVPGGKRLIRAFFGGNAARNIAQLPDETIASIAHQELEFVLGTKLPEPAFSVVRRWPRSLPQYEVGHLERMKELNTILQTRPTLKLLGNAYYGVGLPDLIRDARDAANTLTS